MTARNSLFSERFDDALVIMSMVEEMARADNSRGVDECLAVQPAQVRVFMRYAEAALRAVKRIELEGGQTAPAQPN
jgi:hypothetical protein